MNKRTLITTAAAIFAASTFVATSASAQGVKCTGANACKGQSACKGATNACKGHGFSETSTKDECTAKGGKVM